MTTFVAGLAIDPPAEPWRHTVPSHGGEDSGMVFDCFFLTVPEARNALTVGGQAEFLSLVCTD